MPNLLEFVNALFIQSFGNKFFKQRLVTPGKQNQSVSECFAIDI